MNLHRCACAAIALTLGLGHATPTFAATATAAEYAKHGAVVETGWKLVGTPQILPQDLPRGGGH